MCFGLAFAQNYSYFGTTKIEGKFLFFLIFKEEYVKIDNGLVFKLLPANHINSVDDIEEGKYLVENGEFCNFLNLKEISESENSQSLEQDEGHPGLELEKINLKDLSQEEQGACIEFLKELKKIKLYSHSVIVGKIPCR